MRYAVSQPSFSFRCSSRDFRSSPNTSDSRYFFSYKVTKKPPRNRFITHQALMKNRKDAHRAHMFTLLKYIYTQAWGKHLGFKGGTALYFFHKLPRFSVDLDIDILLSADMAQFPTWREEIQIFIEKQWRTMKKSGTSHHSHHYFIQYGGEKKLKLEFSTHTYPNTYIWQNLLGLKVQVMDIRDMFAHKLCAFIARYQDRGYLASRDLFDIHFLLQQHITPRAEIMKIRSKNLTNQEMTTKQRYTYLLDFINTHEKYLRKHILDGLGELIDDTTEKHRIKKHLIDELREYLWLAVMG